MKPISEALRMRQNNQKIDTITKIKQALADLSSEGHKITIKNLVERTMLSRSVFSKTHVKEFLAQDERFSRNKYLPQILNTTNENSNFQKEYYAILKKYEKLKNINEQNNSKITALKNELYEKKDECEILRGKLHVLMQKCRIKGIEIID